MLLAEGEGHRLQLPDDLLLHPADRLRPRLLDPGDPGQDVLPVFLLRVDGGGAAPFPPRLHVDERRDDGGRPDVRRHRKKPVLPLGLRREELPVVGQDGEALRLEGKALQSRKRNLPQPRRPGQPLVQGQRALQGRGGQDDGLPPQDRVEHEIRDEAAGQDRVSLLLRAQEENADLPLRPDEAGQTHAVLQLPAGEEAPLRPVHGVHRARDDADLALAARPAPPAGRVDLQPGGTQGLQQASARQGGEEKRSVRLLQSVHARGASSRTRRAALKRA